MHRIIFIPLELKHTYDRLCIYLSACDTCSLMWLLYGNDSLHMNTIHADKFSSNLIFVQYVDTSKIEDIKDRVGSNKNAKQTIIQYMYTKGSI